MTTPRTDRASIVYGVLNILSALLYAFLFTWAIPSRETLFSVIVYGISLLLLVAGVGLILRTSWGRVVAKGVALIMLLACATLILLLIASAAYLHGIYDGIGQAGVAICLVLIALSFEVVGLLPALQLAHLRRLSRENPS